METLICKHCGPVNDYHIEQSGPHLKAVCKNGHYIKFLPQNNTEPTLYFPKYKDRTVKSMVSPEEVEYLRWLLGNVSRSMDAKLRNAITEHLKNYPKTI